MDRSNLLCVIKSNDTCHFHFTISKASPLRRQTRFCDEINILTHFTLIQKEGDNVTSYDLVFNLRHYVRKHLRVADSEDNLRISTVSASKFNNQ